MADLIQYRCKLCGATLADGTVKAHYAKLHPKAADIKAVRISDAKVTDGPTKEVSDAYWIASR